MSLSIPLFPRIVKRQHRIYNHSEIDSILKFLTQAQIPWGSFSKISSDTGISVQTLSDWRKHRSSPRGENWYPLAQGHPNMRTFSEAQEKSLVEHIKINFIDTGYGPKRSDIKRMASNAYSCQDANQFRRDRFCASSSFTTSFMNRWRLRLRTPHAERRSHIDEDQAEFFI
jgi:hypothetical protein